MTGVQSKLDCARCGWLIALLLCACSGEDPTGRVPAARNHDGLLVYTVNYPLAYFAERIADNEAEVRFPVPADIDPADWSPTPRDVAEFQQADLILLNGGGYARWLQHASLPRARLIDTSSAFHDRLIERRGGVSHAHGPTGEHSHTGTATTTWLDPRLAIEQARAIAEALSQARPPRAAKFRERFAALETELVELDEQLAAAAGKLEDTAILFSHPVYQYLEERFRLNSHSVHWEPDEAPNPELWRELEASLENHPAQLMIWEAKPAAEIIRRLDALGIRTAVFSPCANAPAEGDWLSAMRAGAAALEKMGDLLGPP